MGPRQQTDLRHCGLGSFASDFRDPGLRRKQNCSRARWKIERKPTMSWALTKVPGLELASR